MVSEMHWTYCMFGAFCLERIFSSGGQRIGKKLLDSAMGTLEADMEVTLVQEPSGLLTKRRTEKTKEFLQYLYCRNFKGKALHRKQSGCVKKCMEMKIGNWTPSCRSLRTVTCMKKWGIVGSVQSESSGK